MSKELNDLADLIEQGQVTNFHDWSHDRIEETKKELVENRRYEAAAKLLDYQRSTEYFSREIWDRILYLRSLLNDSLTYYHDRPMCEAAIEARGGLMVVDDLMKIKKQ